jgi:hypothetical protein
VAAKAVEWSEYRDQRAGNATARETIETSPYLEQFSARLAAFAGKASSHERIRVSWWHAPYLYVEVLDDRREYPVSTRALVSFDLTNGEWAGDGSKRRYAFARPGWRLFLESFCSDVAHYSDEPSAATTARTRGTGTARDSARSRTITNARETPGERQRYVAYFQPEAWVRDDAIPVDPEGPQEWDCTEFASKPDSAAYLARVADWRHESPDDPFGMLDNDDWFRADPAAPEWIRQWRGPFTIRIRRIEAGQPGARLAPAHAEGYA